jgi:hypothetical protein
MAIIPGSDRGTAPEAMPQLAMPTLGTLNQEPMIGIRRVAQMDNTNRVSAQYAHDRGFYSRPPIGPVEFGEGNIKKSTALTGPAGYNQRNIPLPNSPDDMSQAEYMISLSEDTPKTRQMLRQLTSVPKQTMLQTPSFGDAYPFQSSNMADNLLALAKMKKEGLK